MTTELFNYLTAEVTIEELIAIRDHVNQELDRRQAATIKPIRIAKKFGGYNARRYSRPWIGRVTSWPVGGHPEIDFGNYLGTDSGGEAEMMARPGEIIRWGQKDNRNPKHTENRWGIVKEDGTVEELTQAEAREAYTGQ